MDGGGIPWALNGWRRYFLGYGWRKEHSLGTRMEEGAVTWTLMEGRGKPWLKGGNCVGAWMEEVLPEPWRRMGYTFEPGLREFAFPGPSMKEGVIPCTLDGGRGYSLSSEWWKRAFPVPWMEGGHSPLNL